MSCEILVQQTDNVLRPKLTINTMVKYLNYVQILFPLWQKIGIKWQYITQSLHISVLLISIKSECLRSFLFASNVFI